MTISMEENVALDSSKQKTFVKSIRGIKKLIKKNDKAQPIPDSKKEEKAVKPFSMRLKDNRIKKKRKDRGLVYLSHIPHGFYEHQMTEYFKQFGVVTNARVIRSKRTGNSKGFAFVEFKEPSVAQIATETMNNYLMGKRLIKAVYIEPAKQKRRAFRKHWNSFQNPTSVRRRELKKAFNADKSESEELKKAKRLLARLTKTKKRLSELGINYDFFTPVDVPQALQDQLIKNEDEKNIVKKEEKNDVQKEEKNVGKKEKNVNKKEKNVDKKEKNVGIKKVENIKEKNVGNQKMVNKKEKNVGKKVVDKKEKNVGNKSTTELKENNVPKKVSKKEEITDTKVNKKAQDEKSKKLKDVGVKPLEEFISLDADDNDSDSSFAFDSDEYEKMIGDDDDFSSDEESDLDEGSNADADSESDEEKPPVQNGKQKPKPKIISKPVNTKSNKRKQNSSPKKVPVVSKKPMKPKRFKKK